MADGPVAAVLRSRLEAAFQPLRLEVVDDSGRHAGHSGSRAEGETHFTVTVVSERFAGLSRLQRQRAVNTALADLLAERVHALSIRALAPGEAGAS